MRYFKLIVGLICLLLVPIPGLLFLGELFIGVNWILLICAVALVTIGVYLIWERMKRFSVLATTLSAFTVCVLFAFVGLVIIPDFVMKTHIKQASCVFHLEQIKSAKEQWALENGKTNGATVTASDLTPYIPMLKCPLGGTYTVGKLGEDPTCSVGYSAWPNDHVLNATNSYLRNLKSSYRVLFGMKP